MKMERARWILQIICGVQSNIIFYIVIVNHMYSMRRFGGKHHKDFQPERKWEVPREVVQVRQKDHELNHGHNFEISVCRCPGSKWKKSSDDQERGQNWSYNRHMGYSLDLH